MPNSRIAVLLTPALVAGVAALTVLSLARTTDPGVVTRWWPATAVATALVLLAPRRRTRPLLGLLGVSFLVGGLIAGRGWGFSAGFALANVAECGVLVWWLTGLELERAGLRTWGELRRWLSGVALASAAAGVVTAATLGVLGDQDGSQLWRPLLWVALTHAESQAVLLPLVLSRAAHRVRVSRVEVAGHLALLAVGAAACIAATPSDHVAFLLLPLLVWSAARFTQTWASIELLGVAVGIGLLTAAGRGPFAHDGRVHSLLEIAGSAQAFIAVSAITSVSFSVAMSHLRDSLRTIRENEAQLGQLLDSANGTAFVATGAACAIIGGTVVTGAPFAMGASVSAGSRAAAPCTAVATCTTGAAARAVIVTGARIRTAGVRGIAASIVGPLPPGKAGVIRTAVAPASPGKRGHSPCASALRLAGAALPARASYIQ